MSAAKIQRDARLRWVPIADMRVSPLAQRDLNVSWVNKIATEFDLEELGTPTVNARAGHYFVIDGQHRIEALRVIGWEDQQVQCWTYDGLTEIEEAEKFLKLNTKLTIAPFAKFRVGVQAGRIEEGDIDRIVRAADLRVSLDRRDGAIHAVSTLRTIYRTAGPRVLSRTLRMVRDAYGDSGLVAPVLAGIGLLCQRYNGDLEDQLAVARLSAARGGVNNLLAKAEGLRRQTGHTRNHCVAAAAVEIINAGRGGKKLGSWWRQPDTETTSKVAVVG